MEAKQVRDLMEAYASVYQEKEEVNEDLQQKVGQALDAAAENPVIQAIGSAIAPVRKGRGTVTQADQQKRIQQNVAKEEVEQIDETRTDPRGRPASGPMSVYGGRGRDAGPGGSGNANVDRMDAAQRRVKRTQPRDKGMAADALFTRYSGRQRGTGSGENPSPSDRTEKGHPHSPKRGGRKGLGAETDRGSGNAAQRRMKEDFDLFDVILEHLVAEGYADTNKAALAIMANMSEEWREEIVETIVSSSGRTGNTGMPNLGSLGQSAINAGKQVLDTVLKNKKPGMATPPGGYSTKPGDGKPYADGPLWDSNQKPEDVPVRPKPPVRKPNPPMRDEPLW